MSLPYSFPKAARFGRVLPKSKIYQYASPNSKVRELFVREVEKIIWAYKLSPETVNLPARGFVQEIQVFTMPLKTGVLHHEVLETIDKAIPSPILFIPTHANRMRYVMACKRQSEADKQKWVVSDYFETEWMPEDAETTALPVALDLDALYHALLKRVIPVAARPDETMDALAARAERLRIQEREAVKVEARLKKEKQFNRKVEINAELKRLKKEIEALKH